MRIFNSWRRRAIALAVLTGLVAAPIVLASVSFGPSRPTFTWEHPANYVTFNSITDNPQWGDERYLVKARDVTAGTNTYTNNFPVQDNQEILVTTFFHNNADSILGLHATGTKASIALPGSTAATTQTLMSTISADNASPTSVFATMDFTNSQPFSLEYETGSAKLITNYVNMPLSDAVVNGGTSIGTSGTDGIVPGCAQFSGYVTIKVRVHVKPVVTPVFKCDLLNVTTSNGRKVDANVTYTAENGATFQSASFNWGDNTSPTVTSGTTASHTYGKDDKYNITATLTFNVGSTTQTPSCSKQVSFSTPPVTPPTTPPSTPQVGKTLPNTGAGSVVGIFAGVSMLAGAGHYFVTRRVRG